MMSGRYEGRYEGDGARTLQFTNLAIAIHKPCVDLEEGVMCMMSGRYEGGGARTLQFTNLALISLESTK